MLKHRLLLQLHCYPYLIPLTKGLTHRALRSYKEGLAEISSEPSSLTGDNRSNSPMAPSPAKRDFKNGSLHDEPALNKAMPQLDDSTRTLLDGLNLNDAEKQSILSVPASRNLDDLKLFVRLCPYFSGRRHLEDMMYYENVRRSQLLALIDKFRDVLLICQYEDSAVAKLCPYTALN